MYKLLLCWRYLRTRYIALASIISVMLGVATMIVVNSVMEGFTSEMQNRIHGILSDLVFDQREPRRHARRRVARGADPPGGRRRDRGHVAHGGGAGDAQLSAAAANRITQQVQLIGIDEKTQSSVSDFGKYLQHPENRKAMSFELREGGYDVRDHQAGADAPERKQMADGRLAASPSRWPRSKAFQQRVSASRKNAEAPAGADAFGRPVRQPSEPRRTVFDPAKQQHTGAVLGIAMASFRTPDGEDRFLRHARRRREAHLPHGRPAAEDRQRQLHDRRFLRKQDERVRRHVRLRAASASCKSCAA